MEQKLLIYNTLTRTKERFTPLHAPNVGMYVCGPTVYGDPHLGHARPAITFDILFRYLKHLGYKVRYVRNITDVGHLEHDADEGDDKIEKKARLEQLEPMEIAQYYTNRYHQAMEALNVLPPSIEPHATGHIIEQEKLVQEILDNGYAYESNGSIYFDIEKYNKDHKYGILSGRNLENVINESRELAGIGEKKNQADFALWKKASPEHIMRWPSPWSDGFPGWHCECTAMGRKYLGNHFDIHGGGMDLIFPHHENEIAQSECANGCKFVNYWLHNGFVTINKEKMSKSLGNFLTIDDLLKKYDANTIRFFILTNHYRMPVEFSDEALSSAQAGVKRMLNAKRTKINEDLDITQTEEYKAFVEAMDDDLNTSKALAVLFDLTNKANKDDKNAFTILFKLASVLGFTFDKPQLSEEEIQNALAKVSEALGEDFSSMNELIAFRKEARDAKNWDVADKIRITLDECGIVLKDTKDGTTYEAK